MARSVVVALAVVALCLVLLVQDVESKKKGSKFSKKAAKRRMHTIVKDLENNVTALWEEVKELGQPVHVHVHGDGHVMDHDDHDHHEHHHDHDSHEHKTPPDEAQKDHDHDHDKDHHHKHDHKHHQHKSHDLKDKKSSDDHDHEEMKKKLMMMKKMKGGYHHDHPWDEVVEKDEDEDEECKDKYTHEGHGGTHVHIHLHTGKEEEEDSVHHHVAPSLPQEYRYARCDVVSNSALSFLERQNIKGTIFFRQMPDEDLEAKVDLAGFELKHDKDDKNGHQHLRGLHGHEYGEMSNGCNSLGGHLNPFGVSHGGPEAEHRHLGDFGNIEIKEDGTSVKSFTDPVGSLFGSDSMLGRSMVIHTGPDDHGKGDSPASKASGDAGGRIACCVIIACPEPKGVWSSSSSSG